MTDWLSELDRLEMEATAAPWGHWNNTPQDPPGTEFIDAPDGPGIATCDDDKPEANAALICLLRNPNYCYCMRRKPEPTMVPAAPDARA